MVRLAPSVTRKSLPWEASTAIVAASARLTTAGAIAPDSMVVLASAAVSARAGEVTAWASTDSRGPGRRDADAPS